MIDITSEIAGRLPDDFSGIALVYVPHTTAGITINEGADPAVKNDIMNQLQKLAPHSAGYTHLEGNADAHIKSTIVGNTVSLISENGHLKLGTWQAVFFCEFDGPRTRNIYIELLKK
jgi:secondary thiamine-phosphate synthase enzyme